MGEMWTGKEKWLDRYAGFLGSGGCLTSLEFSGPLIIVTGCKDRGMHTVWVCAGETTVNPEVIEVWVYFQGKKMLSLNSLAPTLYTSLILGNIILVNQESHKNCVFLHVTWQNLNEGLWI
jgi:hypothetical protein